MQVFLLIFLKSPSTVDDNPKQLLQMLKVGKLVPPKKIKSIILSKDSFLGNKNHLRHFPINYTFPFVLNVKIQRIYPQLP